jgi:hypothetical protein
MLKVQFVGNFGGALGGSGIVGRLVVDQPFGLVLPSLHESLHEFLGLAIVGDGPAPSRVLAVFFIGWPDKGATQLD